MRKKREQVEIDIRFVPTSVGGERGASERYHGPADVLVREGGLFGGVLVRFRDPQDRRRYYMLTISPEEIVNERKP